MFLKLIVATRKSNLAQTQTDLVINMIKEKYDVECEKLLMETLGDKILDKTLDKIGGKGLFVKEIEMALLENKANIAVHSMKDVPYDVPHQPLVRTAWSISTHPMCLMMCLKCLK